MNTKLNMGVIEDKSITYSKLADDVAESITATMAGSAPDWNAQEGESGHIKNRLCRAMWGTEEYEFKNPLKEDDFTTIYDEDGYILRWEKEVTDIYYDLKYIFANYDSTPMGNTYQKSFYPLPFKNGKWEYIMDDYNAFRIYITKDNDNYCSYLIIQPLNYNNDFPKNLYIIEYDQDYFFIEKLPEVYLPDTIVKTTPQTLSTNAKNQALTNLGIDPVVWKYMCNPLVISVGDTVPEELLGSKYIYGDNTYYKIKYPNRAMYKYKYTSVSEDDSGYVLMDLNTINN